jgi:energy-coupling factor transporter ATP-binding protein EcfA2
LRAKNKGNNFKLASNIKGLGAFDDVFIEYLNGNSTKEHIFLQLKSKVGHKITMQQLLAGKGDFSLRKYYDSYIQVEENYNCFEGVKMAGSIDESLFIIYSNADVVQELKSNKVIQFGEEEFLMTGGSVLQFNEEEHKAIYEHLQDLSKHRDFLSRFRIIYSQSDEKEMDCHIKRELQLSMKLSGSELILTHTCFIDFVKGWWQNLNYFLKETNSKEHDLLEKTKEKVRRTLVAKILGQRNSEFEELSIKYKQSAITHMKQLTEPHKAVLIFAPGSSTTLTAAKIHQMLSATKHTILNLQQLIRYKTEVMLAWKNKFDVLVVESQSSTEDLQDVFSEISINLNECGVEKRFVFIANTVGNTEQQINALRRTFSTKLRVEYDVWEFTDIVTESRTFILEKEVIFQGSVMQIKNIVKEIDVHMLNALDFDSISLLLGDGKPSIGIPIEGKLDYYIDRTLACIQHVETGTQEESELLRPFRKEYCEKLQGASACREKQCNITGQGQGITQLSQVNGNEQEQTRECNETTELRVSKTADQKDPCEEKSDENGNEQRDLERKSTRFWRPGTLLEGESRIVLVIGEPGMGKSTLLTHLAKEARKCEPDVWIVRVNINNYTRKLHEIKGNGFDEKDALKLLTEAAQIKESDSEHLEKQLFNYVYRSTGNMAVLIDGVDEVSPHYTEEVLQLLKLLLKKKIRKIWVTSRNSVKDQIEQELQCQSYSLTPFSVEEQKSFLLKFWNQKYLDTKADYPKHLANRVVELSLKYLSDRKKNFMEVPLQGMLMAEMFEENLQKCSTSTTVELPEYINQVMLYDLYLNRKWDIYLSDKKFSERTNVNMLKDDDFLHDIFIENHKAAALMAILSTHHFEELNDKNVLKIGAAFLHRIEQGLEKTGVINSIMEGRPVFQQRKIANYFVARWLCDNFLASQTFMREHLFESGFGEIRIMVDRILANNCPMHEAVINLNVRYVALLLERKGSINEKNRGGRTPLHVAVSCRSPEITTLLLEHGADISSVDTLLGFSPVEYAFRMNDLEMVSLLMEKRPEIMEQELNEMSHGCTECITSALRATARYVICCRTW